MSRKTKVDEDTLQTNATTDYHNAERRAGFQSTEKQAVGENSERVPPAVNPAVNPAAVNPAVAPNVAAAQVQAAQHPDAAQREAAAQHQREVQERHDAPVNSQAQYVGYTMDDQPIEILGPVEPGQPHYIAGSVVLKIKTKDGKEEYVSRDRVKGPGAPAEQPNMVDPTKP